MSTPSLHIYPFSRLVSAPAPTWERLLAELEADKAYMSRYYQPIRTAVVRHCATGGSKENEVVAQLLRDAASVSCNPYQDPTADNLSAFEVFRSCFFPKVRSFRRSFLQEPSGDLVVFEGVILSGLPHMEVVDHRDRTRYVYLYASDWTDDQLKAYLELLTLVVEERFKASGNSIWCMNLRTGEDIPWKKSSVRIRKACADTAKHFVRLRPGPPIWESQSAPIADWGALVFGASSPSKIRK